MQTWPLLVFLRADTGRLKMLILCGWSHTVPCIPRAGVSCIVSTEITSAQVKIKEILKQNAPKAWVTRRVSNCSPLSYPAGQPGLCFFSPLSQIIHSLLLQEVSSKRFSVLLIILSQRLVNLQLFIALWFYFSVTSKQCLQISSGQMWCLQRGQLLLQSLKEPCCRAGPVLSDRKFLQISNFITTGQSIHEMLTFQYLLITCITYSCKATAYNNKMVSIWILKNSSDLAFF